MSRLNKIPANFTDEIFINLFDTAEYINLTVMERTIEEIRQKIEWDNKNVHDFAMEEAERKGMKEMALEMARALKQDGVSIALIKKASGLSDLEIESL